METATITETITLEALIAYLSKGMQAASNTAEFHQALFAQVRASETSIKAELNKLTKVKLSRFSGYGRGGSEKKESMVDSAWRHLLTGFALSDTISYGFHDTYEDVIARYVAKVTDESLAEYRAGRVQAKEESQARNEAMTKAVENPQTEKDFELCIYQRGVNKLRADKTPIPRKQSDVQRLINITGMKELTDDELARFDELMAAKGHDRRAKEMIEKATIKRIEIGDGNYMEIAKVYHTKREAWRWIVILAEREDRTTFEELCIAARKLGGDYQRAYAPADSPGGFAFDDEETATQFVTLQSRDLFVMQRLEKLCAHRDRVRSNAVDHLHTLGDRMTDRADDTLTEVAGRRLNTERRIAQAERTSDKAHADIAMAGTLHNTANALLARLALHTDKIRWRTHAEAFERVLNEARGRMAAVEYPWPVIGVHALQSIIEQIGDKDGSIMVSRRIVKMAEEQAARGGSVIFNSTSMTETLRHFYRRARLHRVRGWALDAVREALGDFKRVRLIGLDTLPELRAALREHQGRRVEVTEMTRAEKVMRDLYPGAFPPDYFPTPKDVVDLMLEYAGIDPDVPFSWLEPSAGSGHIVNVVRERFPNSSVALVEMSGLLCKALNAQGHSVNQEDFLKIDPTTPLMPAPFPVDMNLTSGGFDYIIMNPPFGSEGVGTDIDHVLHAYQFLKPGGRLISLMSDGVFYRGDNKAQSFRAWLESLDGDNFELPEGAFLNADRPTSWAARVVIVDKPTIGESAAGLLRDIKAKGEADDLVHVS